MGRLEAAMNGFRCVLRCPHMVGDEDKREARRLVTAGEVLTGWVDGVM